MQPSPCLVRILSPHTYKLESWSVGCPEPPLVWPLQWPRFPYLLTWINDACSLHPEDKALRPRVRKGPALGAGSLPCPRPRCSAPLPSPPSSALSSASPVPRPCGSRLQLLLSFPSLTPPCAGVATRCRPRPRHPRRPGQAAAQATSARPGVLAERDRRLRPKPTQGEGSPEEAGA